MANTLKFRRLGFFENFDSQPDDLNFRVSKTQHAGIYCYCKILIE